MVQMRSRIFFASVQTIMRNSITALFLFLFRLCANWKST